MPSTFIVNMMSAVHSSSSGMAIAFPDVCQTPSPVGPIPIPYPNIGMSSDASDAASTVKADGTGVMIESSTFATSMGDEAGSVGGVVSGQIKGKAYPKLYSMDVKADGEGVFRLLDIMLHNGSSPTNTPPATEIQAPGMAMAMADGQAEEAEPPKITKVEVSPASVCCGDEVDIEVETENFPDGMRTSIVAVVDDKRRRLPGPAQPKVSGDKGSATWAVRRGPWQEEVKLRLRAEGRGGPCEAGEELEVKTAGDDEATVDGELSVRRHVWARLGSGQYTTVPVAPTTVKIPWVYGIKVAKGQLVVERLIELQGNGFTPTSDQKDRWKRDIERYWDNRYKLHRADCVRGDGCNCAKHHGCCMWPIRVQVTWGPGHGKAVVVQRGANPARPDPKRAEQWWSSHNWFEARRNMDESVRAHEFGHLIGLYDEYGGITPGDQVGDRQPGRTFTDMTRGEGLMGGGHVMYERYFEGFKKWFDDTYGDIVGPTKLLKI